jgi:hypothetical protein
MQLALNRIIFVEKLRIKKKKICVYLIVCKLVEIFSIFIYYTTISKTKGNKSSMFHTSIPIYTSLHSIIYSENKRKIPRYKL